MPDSAQVDQSIEAAAEKLLTRDDRLTFDEARALQALPESQLGHLAELAHQVRLKYCGDAVELCSIISGKTGGCPEDCHFCSQSALSDGDVAPTGYIDYDDLMTAAEQTAQTGATEFCIIYAVKGPDRRLMDHVIECVERVRAGTDLDVACSMGLLSREQAFELAEHGVRRYNHNLETARSYFPEVCTTHAWEDRRATCELILEAGMELCCGGIIGLGESREQRLELAFELAELAPTEVPVNFLNPRPGTQLADRGILDAHEAIRTIALIRLILPKSVIRYGGGREITLGDLQALGLKAGVNGMITGNYLTTFGQSYDRDIAMLEELEMPVGAVGGEIR